MKNRLSRFSLISSCLGQVLLARLGRDNITSIRKENQPLFPYLKLLGTIVWPNLRAAVAKALET